MLVEDLEKIFSRVVRIVSTETCILIDGTVRRTPVAQIEIETTYYTGKVKAVCMDNPLYDVVVLYACETRADQRCRVKQRRCRVVTGVADAFKAPTRGRFGRLQPCFDVDRGTDARSLLSSAAGLRPRRRRPTHAAHVVDADEIDPLERPPLPLSLLLLSLLLLSLLLLRVAVVHVAVVCVCYCLLVLLFGDPRSVSSCLACCNSTLT